MAWGEWVAAGLLTLDPVLYSLNCQRFNDLGFHLLWASIQSEKFTNDSHTG